MSAQNIVTRHVPVSSCLEFKLRLDVVGGCRLQDGKSFRTLVVKVSLTRCADVDKTPPSC